VHTGCMLECRMRPITLTMTQRSDMGDVGRVP
jgi:hypothetical protein